MIGQSFQVPGNGIDPSLIQQFEALLESVKERRGARAAFPRESGRFEWLLAVLKIPGSFHAYPTDHGRLDPFACAVRKIDQPTALRRTQPFVTDLSFGPRKIGRAHV